MKTTNLDALINTIANNHGVTVPARNAQRKMRDARDADDEATARGEDAATSAPTDASMQLAQADTGVATEAAASETAAGASGATAAGEAAAGTGAAAGGGIGLGGLGLGGLALGGAALAGGGGGGGGGVGSAVAAVVNNIITGTVVAGTVLGGNGLKVEIYAANGTTKLGESTLDATGKFTVDVGSYSGIVIARLVDANGGDDYLDEATGVPKDLNANLMATSVVTGGTFTLNINPLTTIAAQKAGLAADGSGSLTDATAVANANAAVAAAFGLTDLTGTSVVATNGGSYDSTNGMSDGEKYGAILAALSGADFASSGNSQAVIDQLVAAINVSGSTGTLSSAGLTLMLDGAATADDNVAGDAVQDLFAIITEASVDSSDVTAPNAPVIDPVAGDNVINAAEQTTAITGTAEANALVKLTLGGNTRNVVADGSGNWSYTLVAADIAAMGQGAETLSATATDAAGNTGAAGTRGITVDTTAPTQTVSGVDISADTGTSATDFITNTAAQTITGTLSAALAAGDILYGSVNNGGTWTNITNKVTTTAISWDGATLSGSSTLLFKITDAAGNDSATTGSTAYVLDTTAPTANFTSATDNVGSVTGTLSSGATTDDTALALAGTCESGSTVNVYNGTTLLGAATVTGTGWSYTATVADGTTYQFNVKETDAAGNVSAATSNFTVIGDATAPTQTVSGVNNIVTGTVVAGPVLGGNGLKVEIYAANGTTKLGESTLDASGKFTVDVGSYTGIVIARLVDANGGDDYLDEATGVPKDLNAKLMATSVVTGGTFTLNINPLTTIAAQKAGLAADGSGALADTTAVANANAAVAAAFGLADLTGTSVVATNGGSYDAADGMSAGEKYGAILAALSGADFASSGDSQAIINNLVAAIDITGATGTLSATGQSVVTAGAAVGDNDFVADVLNTVRGGTAVPSAPTINTVAIDNIINAAEVGSVISGINETGATVALSIGGNTRAATVNGATWSYTLTDADLTAMGQGAETLGATQADVLGNTSSAGTRAINVDTVAPVFSSATVSGRTLVLTYNEALDADSMPLRDAFIIKVGTIAQGAPVAGVVDSAAKTITLTLASPIAFGQTGITVSYTDPTVGNDLAAIQDIAGNDAATISTQGVTNSTPDAPLYKSATVTGSSLVMIYEGDLDEINLPPLNAFTVKVDGAAQAEPTAVAVNQAAKTVTLTLATPVINGQTVTVGYTDPTAANDINAIQDAFGNDALSVGNRLVLNQTLDVATPVFASAAVSGNGKYLALTYDDALDAGHLPPLGTFTVKVDGVVQASPTGAVVNSFAGIVTLTLAQPVTYGQTVFVSYTDPTGGNDLAATQDKAGNDAATLTDQAVINNASEVPFFEGATFQDNTLVLIYNKALDAVNIPQVSNFTVTVGDGDPVAPDTVVVDSAAKTVTLTLPLGVTSGQTVKVSYTDPTIGNDANAIQDAAGNDADSLENQSVTNLVAPVFSGLTSGGLGPSVNGSTLVLNYDTALDAVRIPPASAFIVNVAGNDQTPTNVVVNAAAGTVTLTLGVAVKSGESVKVSYTDPTTNNDTNAIQDAFGNDAISVANESVGNHTPPVFVGASVNGNTLALTYSAELSEHLSYLPLVSAFTVKVNGTAQAVPLAVAVDAAAKTVTLTLAAAVTHGQAVFVSYTDPTTDHDTHSIKGENGVEVTSVSNQRVTNTTLDAIAPVFSSATVSGSTLVLTYSEALDAANAPEASTFIVKVGGTAQDEPTAVVVDSAAKTVTLTLAAAVTHGQAVTVSYVDPTAGNDVSAIQDTTGNDAISLTDKLVTNTTVNAAAPTLTVVTSAGNDVNEIRLAVTSGSNGADSVDLSFSGLPVGTIVKNLANQVVTSGVTGFDGSDIFTVEFPEGVDIHQNLLVTVTGKDAGGVVLGDNVQTIELVYDVSSSTEDVNFASANQNMWGNFNGYIGWHEYVPLLGGAPIIWNAATGEWDDAAAPDYWRSGEFGVIDIELDSAEIVAAVATAATGALDAAKAVFDVAAVAVDTVAKGVYDAAKAVLQTAQHVYYYGARTVDAAVQATFKAAQDVYNFADSVYDTASHVFHTLATGAYNSARKVYTDYDNWYHSLDWGGQFWNALGHGANDTAWGLANQLYSGGYIFGIYVPGAVQIWDAAKNAFETTATGIYNTALAVYNAAAGAANAAAQVVFDDAKAVFALAENVYNEVKQDIHEAAQVVYDTARNGVMAVLQTVNDKVDFNSTLKVDSEVFAQVGLQVDFELDMGSVDTDVDFQLTSTTQYNKSTNMLTITPMMTNMTTGDSVAFDTISPNAKVYAALLYDVGADFDVFVDGKLVVDGTPIYDLSPTSDGLNLKFPISTESFASALGVIAGGNIDVGKMVLLDLDTSKLEPMEVPFIEALTQGILSIEVAVPTLETEGKAVDDEHNPITYDPATTYKEGDLISVDFSEISSAFFNIIGARFDFSQEFMDAYGLDSLNGKTLAETVEDVATGLMANIWDVLGGQSEGVPIFVLDMTDESASSLLHVNLFPDSVMTDTTSANTGSLGFYAAYGESDPVVAVTVDLDAAYVAIVKAIAKAAASAVTAGAATTIHPVIDAIPNPYDLEFGVEQVLKIASVPQTTIDQITKWVNLGFEFETVDIDVTQDLNFSQDFTLSIDDMSYLVTMEDGVTQFAFTANGTGAIEIPNASTYDVNGDGLITYTLNMVPTAMFSNDTEVGLA